MKKLIFTMAVLALSTAQADVIHVDVASCPGPGNGSEADPYCSIQAAIDNAVNTDEIVVAPGTYFETINFIGKAVWLHSSDGPEVTIIDAQQAGTVVTCENGEGPATIFEGFTITGGSLYGVHGAGMRNIGSSPQIINCRFEGNAVFDSGGGGLFNSGGSPTITDSTFSRNIASVGFFGGGYGGGMVSFGGDPVLTNCLFLGNSAVGPCSAAGAMSNGLGNLTLSNCAFIGNSSQFSVMSNGYLDLTITNCIFIGNFTEGGGCGADMSVPAGGAVVMGNYNCTVAMTNCTLDGNISNEDNNSLTVVNCILWTDIPIYDALGATTNASHSDIKGGYPGTGNIDVDPLFVRTSACCDPYSTLPCDAPDCGTAVCEVLPFCCDDASWGPSCALMAQQICTVCPNDYRLQAGSPCIDAGDNTAVPEDITTDLDGNARFIDDPDTDDTGNGDPPVVDMGAYEFQGGLPCPWDLDGDGNVGITDLLLLLEDFGSCDGSPADFDGDGCVAFMDLLTLLFNFGPCPDGGCPWDVTGDGTVDLSDLFQLLGNLGPCDGCPEDINGDGVVDGQDVVAVITHLGPCP